MPHLTVEYTGNLPTFNPEAVLRQLNAALLASAQFEEADIKSRAVRLDDFLVGSAPQGRAFVHARLALLSGRPVDVKRDLSTRLLAALQQVVHDHAGLQLQLSVEIQDMERESYAKAVIA